MPDSASTCLGSWWREAHMSPLPSAPLLGPSPAYTTQCKQILYLKTKYFTNKNINLTTSFFSANAEYTEINEHKTQHAANLPLSHWWHHDLVIFGCWCGVPGRSPSRPPHNPCCPGAQVVVGHLTVKVWTLYREEQLEDVRVLGWETLPCWVSRALQMVQVPGK